MDIFSSERRSEIMGMISGKNTKPEIAVRKILHKMGYRFRNHANLPGKPDICLPKYKTVIFVHGCYWHRHKGCKRGDSVPSSNTEFWLKKFEDTQQRDKRSKKVLSALGWKVIIIWQCDLSKPDKVRTKLQKILDGA